MSRIYVGKMINNKGKEYDVWYDEDLGKLVYFKICQPLVKAVKEGKKEDKDYATEIAEN